MDSCIYCTTNTCTVVVVVHLLVVVVHLLHLLHFPANTKMPAIGKTTTIPPTLNTRRQARQLVFWTLNQLQELHLRLWTVICDYDYLTMYGSLKKWGENVGVHNVYIESCGLVAYTATRQRQGLTAWGLKMRWWWWWWWWLHRGQRLPFSSMSDDSAISTCDKRRVHSRRRVLWTSSALTPFCSARARVGGATISFGLCPSMHSSCLPLRLPQLWEL